MNSETREILNALLAGLTEARRQQTATPEHVRTMRQQGTIEGLNIAIAAIRRRIK